jgi:hypothetical protein
MVTVGQAECTDSSVSYAPHVATVSVPLHGAVYENHTSNNGSLAFVAHVANTLELGVNPAPLAPMMVPPEDPLAGPMICAEAQLSLAGVGSVATVNVKVPVAVPNPLTRMK